MKYRKIVVDECPDANGHWTVRYSDGTQNGDLNEQPIATFYRKEHAELFVHHVPIVKTAED